MFMCGTLQSVECRIEMTDIALPDFGRAYGRGAKISIDARRVQYTIGL